MLDRSTQNGLGRFFLSFGRASSVCVLFFFPLVSEDGQNTIRFISLASRVNMPQ